MDNRNIIDKYKGWHEDLIKKDLSQHQFPFAVLMEHLQGDFNIGTVVRNANAFGAKQVYYTGKKKWDRRGAVGTHNYTSIEYLESLTKVKSDFTFVALENLDQSIPMYRFDWPKNAMIVIGEEGTGLSEEMLNHCEYIVSIPQYGSVRSLNAGTAAGIAMYDYVKKYEQKHDPNAEIKEKLAQFQSEVDAIEALHGRAYTQRENKISLKRAVDRAVQENAFYKLSAQLTEVERNALLPLLTTLVDKVKADKTLKSVRQATRD